MNNTVLGMPLDVDSAEMDDIAVPLAAATVIRSMDKDGEISHRWLLTDGLSMIDAAGMVRWMDLRISKLLSGHCCHHALPPGDGDDGED